MANEGAVSGPIAEFNAQNLSPSSILEFANGIPTTVGGIPGIGSSIPGLGKIGIPGLDKIGQAIGTVSQVRLGKGGEWESLHYGADLNNHHPKFKFLFKVKFEGFSPADNPTSNFYYYVHRIDKPKIRLQHTDVNYYNFRTRVLTHTSFDPLTITFLDEIGNTVNEFFVAYMKNKSGQANGNWGINQGHGQASSSFPYDSPKNGRIGQTPANKGYADGKQIIVEQIFANGTTGNRFFFINPRIESFDFDELNMDDNAGSSLTCTFSYDALRCETNETGREGGNLLYTWGKTDLLRAGGTSGPENAGQTSGNEVLISPGGSASGIGIVTGDSPISINPNAVWEKAQQGAEIAKNNLTGILSTPFSEVPILNGINSITDTFNKNFSNSVKDMVNGSNFKFGGKESPNIENIPSLATPPIIA